MVEQNKDFTQHFLREGIYQSTESSPRITAYPNQKLDPYVYVTPEVSQEIAEMRIKKAFQVLVAASIATLITAPLETVSSSLQLSVKPHKDIYVSQESRTKQLARLNTQLTVAEKRQLELRIHSGSQFQPYTAPVYTGYRQAIRNLWNQGWTSFYKGTIWRLIHRSAHFMPFCLAQSFVKVKNEYEPLKDMGAFVAKTYASLCIVDWGMNAFQVLDNRYTLQNNIRQFRVFRNPVKASLKIFQRSEAFIGAKYHLFSNLLEFSLKFPLYYVLMSKQKLNEQVVALFYLAEAINYPFLTAYRRLTCQSPTVPGMIPKRYSGMTHAVRLIRQEEGLKGLYSGFGLHSLTVATRLAIMQAFCLAANFQNSQSVLY